MNKTVTMRLFALLLVIIPFAALQFGCGGNGGGSNTSGTGTAALSITWPTRSRLIPTASNSIRIVITQNGTTLANQLVPRPAAGGTSSVTINSLKVGALVMTATAYPYVDGTGTAQATGMATINIADNQTTSVALTMNSTIDHLEATPPAISTEAGTNSQLVVTAKDASNAIVLITPGKITYVPSTSAVTANATGLAHAAGQGSGQITVTETESNKQVTVQYTITAVSGTVLYVASSASAELVRSFTPDFVHIRDFGSIFLPSGVAVDTAGNLYVGVNDDGAGNTIRKFSPSGTDLGIFATIYAAPVSLRFDSAGDLIVLAHNGPTSSKLYRISPAGATGTLLASFTGPSSDLAVDSSRNIYVSLSTFSNNILKFAPDGTSLGVFASVAGSSAMGLAFDSSGNLYASAYNGALGDTIQKFSSTGQSLGTFATGIFGPRGLAFDSSGYLYAGEAAGSDLVKISPAGVLLTRTGPITAEPDAIAFGPPAAN